MLSALVILSHAPRVLSTDPLILPPRCFLLCSLRPAPLILLSLRTAACYVSCAPELLLSFLTLLSPDAPLSPAHSSRICPLASSPAPVSLLPHSCRASIPPHLGLKTALPVPSSVLENSRDQEFVH